MQRPYEALRGPMRVWYSRMLACAPTTPAPRTAPTATTGVGAADRVLLVGNGPLHGWGVLTHGLSVVGHLADDLWRRTGRAARVDLVGDERMTLASARAWLGRSAEDGYDVVVLAAGLNDALRLEPVDRWACALDALLDAIVAGVSPSTRIVLVELPKVRAYAMADGPLGTVAQHHADRLNAVLRQRGDASQRMRVVPAPVERFEPGRPIGSSGAYEHWAHQLGDELAPALDAVRAIRPPLPEPAATEHDWAGTRLVLEAAQTEEGHAGLVEIARRAQERFGVALAAVNLVDGDRVHFAASSGGAPQSVPSELAYCAVAVEQDAALVVPDSRADDRFRDNPFLDVVSLPFYAGVPVRSRSGRPIGTVCVLDSTRRDASFAPVEQLQRFADEAEAILRGVEDAAGRGTTAAPVPPAEVREPADLGA